MIPWSEPNIKKEDIDYVKKVLDSGWFTMGKEVKSLENCAKEYAERNYAVAVNNGTSALVVALRSLGIGHGDEVIVPALSFISTATAVSLVGAKPVFVDVGDDMCIDTREIKPTKKIKAIIAVDFGGSPCDHDRLCLISKENQIPILLDGAHSLGSTYNDRQCLSYGLISTMSFHTAKILTTVEGGMIFTTHRELSEKMRAIRTHGETNEKYVHNYLGGNYRMSDVLASFGVMQFNRLNQTLINRNKKANLYRKILGDGFVKPKHGKSCDLFFMITPENRDEVANHLTKNSIDTRKMFPMTIPQQPVYSEGGVYPKAEWFCDRCLSLPLYDGLSTGDIVKICECVEEVRK